MSFDRATRNLLAGVVGKVRERLKADVMDELRRLGFQDDGTVLDLRDIGGLTEGERTAAEELRALLTHLVAAERGTDGVGARGRSEREVAQAAYDRMAREIGFTTLNRMVALRMAEERGLIVQSVGAGLASSGFQIYERLANSALGSRHQTYRAYLECLYDEIVRDLPALFDCTDPHSRIFPSERCLEDVLGWLNAAELASLWAEDETIGWIYQYYNDADERKKMRESQAPRTSRELAVRNQFFTPRYVVEFLTDNTLGRLWYEMTRGETALADTCRYLVRRPNEIFLAEGQPPPQEAPPEVDLSPEELLKQTVYIPHRPFKDPRDIKVLDPAVGSAHFLLYAFDLFVTIYEEAEPELPREEIPALILRHNLHGIDIDPRAVQIANLTLYLKARKHDKSAAIRTANIVCAAPMPGDLALFRQFLTELNSPTLARIAEAMWKELKLAGEMGSLLKPEVKLRGVIAEQRQREKQQNAVRQRALLPELERPAQQILDFSDVTDETFWEQAEERILTILREYTEQASNADATARRLFAGDSKQGFRFVDLLRAHYDVVVMNPPFGEGVPSVRTTLEGEYPHSKNDIYATFVERGLDLLYPDGALGALTSRTGFFLTSFKDWRKEILLSHVHIEAVTDLGYGVLDKAMVETVAYTLRRTSVNGDLAIPSVFVRLLTSDPKDASLEDSLATLRAGAADPRLHFVHQESFRLLPGAPFPYWVSDAMRELFHRHTPLQPSGAEVRVGLSTKSDFRFVRCSWEVHTAQRGQRRDWAPFAKGGEFSPYHADVYLMVYWADDGRELKAFSAALGQEKFGTSSWSRWINSADYYFRPGLTYPSRTTSAFNLRCMPEGCIFSVKGPGLFTADFTNAYVLGLGNSRLFGMLLSLSLGAADTAARSYEVGTVQKIPYIAPPSDLSQRVGKSALRCHDVHRDEDRGDETTHAFNVPDLLLGKGETLAASMQVALDRTGNNAATIASHSVEIDRLVLDLYGISAEDRATINEELGVHPGGYPDDTARLDGVRFRQAYLTKEEVADEDVEGNPIGVDEEKTPRRSRVRYRDWEDLAHLFRVHPAAIARRRAEMGLMRPEELAVEVEHLLSYCLGVAFGRWDVRIGKDPTWATMLGGAFDALPVCSPGMLTEDARREGGAYPSGGSARGAPGHPQGVPLHGSLALVRPASVGGGEEQPQGVPQHGALGLIRPAFVDGGEEHPEGMPQHGSLALVRQASVGGAEEQPQGVPQHGALGLVRPAFVGGGEGHREGMPQHGSLALVRPAFVDGGEEHPEGMPQHGSSGLVRPAFVDGGEGRQQEVSVEEEGHPQGTTTEGEVRPEGMPQHGSLAHARQAFVGGAEEHPEGMAQHGSLGSVRPAFVGGGEGRPQEVPIEGEGQQASVGGAEGHPQRVSQYGSMALAQQAFVGGGEGGAQMMPIHDPQFAAINAGGGAGGPLPYRPERLPAKPEDVPDDYPVLIEWSGLLVDDTAWPEYDVVARVQGVLAYLFEERAADIEQEACEILKVKGLREYFRRPASFFAGHLSQYSKSRRQAPIYWPLSTASGSYTIWVYYHRLTSDTLFTAVNRYVLPKLTSVERELAELETRPDGASGREVTRLREQIDGVREFRDELGAFRDELLRVAALPYRPDLNDGVIINAAPLHRLFRLPKWAKDTRECWSKLERGDYDWAHLAYTMWPERVREKCRADKSLAIAHGLEELYVEPPATARKKRGRVAVMVSLDEAADDE